MEFERKRFGTLATGEEVDLFILKSADLALGISAYGATLVSLVVPGRSGRDDVLLGFSTLGPYTRKHPFFGSTVGRYANRIAGGRFSLGGKDYVLARNNGPNSLHGGLRGFDKHVWEAEVYREGGGVYLRLSHTSPDGDEGYPGTLRAAVTYGLSGDNEVSALYEAEADAPCPVNLTNHAYFNLAGEGRGAILDQEAALHASAYLPVDATLIPTGELAPVAGTPFDFRIPKPIGRDLEAAGGGYDHCFVVDGAPGELRPCARVSDPGSGRTLEVRTTQPGVQFYTGNFLDGIPGKRGALYGKHAGFCLETQGFPDAPNQAAFPDCVYGPGRAYRERTVFSFDY